MENYLLMNWDWRPAGFNINAEKSIIAWDNLEYLGFEIIRQGFIPSPDDVQAIKHMDVPTNKKQLRSFIGNK